MANSFEVGKAPWETESQGGFEVGSAPWETSVPAPAVEQAHPDVSWTQRAVVKNFSNSPEASAAYLNKEGFETEIKDGNLYVRKPGEKDFKALDPSGAGIQELAGDLMKPGFDLFKKPPAGASAYGNLKEFAQDITDLGYDIPAGVATGAATAAGGLAGNIPGAMAAGGGTAAGLEGLRQKLGQYAGIPQEISGRDVAIAGGIGALAPVLFGTGATAAQILKAGISPQTQRSLVTKGIEKAFPTVGRITSGVPKKAIETYIQRGPEVDSLIAQGPDAATNLAEITDKQIKDQFFAKKKEVGAMLGERIGGSQNVIPRDEIFLPLEKRVADMVKSERSLTPAGQAEIDAIRSEISALKEGLPDQITPQTAWEIQDQLKTMANFHNIKGTFQARYGAGATGAEKALSNASAEAVGVINKQLDEAANTSGLKKEYTQLSRLQEKLQKYFKDPEKTEKTLLQLDAKSKGAARKTVDELESVVGNTGVRDNANLLESYSYFQNPELLPISSGGTTSTSRTLGLSSAFEALGGLGGEKGRALGRAVGSVAGGPKAVKAAIKTGKSLSKAGAIPQRLSPWLGVPYRDYNDGN